MRLTTIAMAAALMALNTAALAQVSADEAKQLGTTLTPWGAEKGASKDGSIPAYTGGVANPPKADYASGVLPDPFAADKVLLTINAKNMDQHADKLSPGLMEMMRRYPTFAINVYPTRRSVSYPPHLIDNTLKNATRCALKDDGETLDASQGCRGGFPFPIPKDGKQAMWNHSMAYYGPAKLRYVESNIVKPTGDVVQVLRMMTYEENHFHDPEIAVPTRYMGTRSEYLAPTRLNGQSTVMYDSLVKSTRSSWSYQPSTKRARLAPDFAADTPIATNGGTMLFDEINMFSGAMDRFDWKLVGKKEMYIPYNVYGTYTDKNCALDGDYFQRNHVKNECTRWELHRVWHIQATLKEGKRHVYSKRDLFLDEDSWYGGISDTYDHNGKNYRVLWAPLRPDYLKHAPIANADFPVFDLTTGSYVSPRGVKAWSLDKRIPANWMTAESLPNFGLKAPQ